MSTAPQQPAEPAAQVTVTLDSCAKEDAGTVLDALHTSFAGDRADTGAPSDAPGAGPTVWTATFDVSRTLALPGGPAPLGSPVTLTAQGGYHAVDRIREALSESFKVTVTGTASGDQEQEATFRLTPR
ncbi:hypothetical protein [Actinacidiphila bryophytorum]|uniref:Uncharacterized protein n=2 Tax=Actinacidiphila bryophytorum TaxID=1436133 RepID=A0A9W4H7C7_9ACTN|nr:hypothetical protein [Actinacidiphila bryophytorum]MBM9437603.1 hypothetical protein [Actinacidiphila bryophytorum]CAG7655770.1 conserved hypothetical protein [Actinacidiphila bryophytorum]